MGCSTAIPSDRPHRTPVSGGHFPYVRAQNHGIAGWSSTVPSAEAGMPSDGHWSLTKHDAPDCCHLVPAAPLCCPDAGWRAQLRLADQRHPTGAQRPRLPAGGDGLPELLLEPVGRRRTTLLLRLHAQVRAAGDGPRERERDVRLDRLARLRHARHRSARRGDRVHRGRHQLAPRRRPGAGEKGLPEPGRAAASVVRPQPLRESGQLRRERRRGLQRRRLRAGQPRQRLQRQRPDRPRGRDHRLHLLRSRHRQPRPGYRQVTARPPDQRTRRDGRPPGGTRHGRRARPVAGRRGDRR